MFRIGRLLTRLASRNSLTCRVQPIALQSKCLFSYDRSPVHRTSAPLCFMPSSRRSVSTEASPDPGRYKLSTIPNALCVGRIIATPFVGYLVVQHQFPVAFALFAVAGATDMLDGYIARNFPGQKSLLGSVLDPIADKLLVSVMFVTMSCASLIPWQLTAVVLTRDLCLVVGGFYKRYQTMEPPYSLKRFFNPEVSSMQVVPTMISKVNTVLQLSLIATCLSIPVFSLGDASASLSCGLCWVTALTTVWSGLQYASGRAFKKI